MNTYITYNAGRPHYPLWEVERFDSSIDWHRDEFRGTYAECKKEAHYQMREAGRPHYPLSKSFLKGDFDY